MGICRERLTPLYQMLSISYYSRMGLNSKATDKAASTYHAFSKEQPLFNRIRFALLCAFTGKAYRALDTEMHKEAVLPQYPAVGYQEPGRPKKKSGKQQETEAACYRPPADYVPPKARSAEEIAAEMAAEGEADPGKTALPEPEAQAPAPAVKRRR